MNHFRAAPAGTLRINAARTPAYLLIAPLMPRFLAAYPDINFELVDDDGFVDVIAGGFDAGVRIHEGIPEDMVGVPLGGAQRLAIVASPGYFADRDLPVHPNDLLQHQCIRIRFPSGRTYRWEFEKDNEALEIDVGTADAGRRTPDRGCRHRRSRRRLPVRRPCDRAIAKRKTRGGR